LLSIIFALLNLIGLILVVAVALGFVLFVHELGHFIVAKLCGVKCEKFYLGFDIGGWKLCKFRWGETEYGIGILPLGGYVKMLGQEDNPARIQAEIERAKLQKTAATPSAASPPQPNAAQAAQPFDLAAAEKALYDPRSYLAKSVPKRMAIISAGVIMNVIFAFFMAIAAYYLGVEQLACGVGDVLPGDAAWRAGLKPGDQIVEISGNKTERFQDLLKYVTVGDIDNGVTMLIERPGVKEPLKFFIHPDFFLGRPTIGITPPYLPVLLKEENCVIPGSAAAQAKPALRKGDRIVMVDGLTVANYQQLNAYFAEHPDKPLHLTVECTVPPEGQKHDREQTSKLVQVVVPPQPMRSLGLVMTMGEILAIQDGSPAATAGIKVHDRIVKVDGNPPGDPMTLPARLRPLAGQTVTLTIDREGLTAPLDFPVTLRRVDWIDQPQMKNNLLPVPELGIAYRVLNRVDQVLPGSPAEKADIQPGEMVQMATISPPENQLQEEISQSKITISFDEKNQNWPFFFYKLQMCYPGSPVELVLNNNRKATLLAENAADWFNPDRGFLFEPETSLRKAQSFAQAIHLGAEETWESLTLVVRVLRKLGSQISVTELSGPISIARFAGRAAQQGPAALLLFLTLLSANLAVLNLLPIPLLDGGHLIFLCYEGIRGKPADERVQIALSILGFVFLIGLMIFLLGMDIVHLFF
jgi:regulator of sigma E protease